MALILSRVSIVFTLRVLSIHQACLLHLQFELNPPICNPNDHVWAGGRKTDVKPHRLLFEREMFVSHVLVSATCVGGKRASARCG